MNHIVKYNKPRAGSGAVSASGAAVALQSLAGLLTEAQLSVILEGYLLKETFDDLFVKESDGKGGYRIRAKYAFYTNEWMSCLGANPDAGTVALGATTLGGLNNVVAAADESSAAAKVLVREAGSAQWTLANLSDIVGLDTAALATYLSNNHYATQQWVQLQGYLTEHQSLDDYAKKTWVQTQGYLTAITKAQVEAVLTGDISTHSHSQYLTSALAAQTYQPKGDYALTSALNSAVSSLNTAIGAKLDAATFDDLFVKESDGNGGYRIRAKYAFYSNQYISCLGNNPGAGTSPGGGVDLDAVAEYLQQQGYATQAWVRAQGYITPSALNNYVTLDTAQTITGVKTFTNTVILGTRGSGNPTTAVDSILMYLHPTSHTGGLWCLTSYDIPNQAWLRFCYGSDETITFSHEGVFYANSIRKRGGTSSQFLKADGSVDSNHYLTTHQPLNYINVQDTRDAATSTSADRRLTAHFKDNGAIGLSDGGLYAGLLHFQPWRDASGGSAYELGFTVNGNLWLRSGAIGSAWGAWRKLLDTNNYTSVLDSRYVNVSGDTMTGVLNIAHNSTNHVIKTQYNTAGDYTNVIYATVDNSRVIFASPAWATVELETAGAAVWRRTAQVTYKIWDSGNDGPGSGLDADLLDGYHVTSMMTNRGRTISNFLTWDNATGEAEVMYWTPDTSNRPYGYGAALCFRAAGSWHYRLTFDTDAPRVRLYQGINTTTLHHCGDLAFTSDNVASATRLQGTYSLWGQSFYGNNVSGNMSGVGIINSAAAPINTIYASDWYRSIGATGWYNQTYGGGWYMDNASWIKSWDKPVYIGHMAYEGANSFGVGLRCYHAGHTSVEVQGGSYTMGLGCHSNGSWYWWRGTSAGKSHVMIYNGTTWSFTGVIKTNLGMYSDGYMSCLGQNTGSDMRLKHIIGDVTLSLDMIADAPAKLFRWRYGEFAGRVAVGSIAQYWQQWLSPVVSKRPDDYLQMDYGVTALTASICLARIVRDGLSEHERRILALELEKAQMQKENQELRKQINELERRLAA